MSARDALLVAAFAVLAAPLSTDLVAAQGQHESRSVGLPTAGQLVLCHGHGCRFKTPVAVTPADRARLGGFLSAGGASAPAERAAIARAVAWTERRYGADMGTRGDRPRTGYTDAGDRGQLDCVDESLNTTAVLLYLEGQGWLRHHKVGAIVSRGYFLDLRYPHQTAVIRTRRGGEAWAVDSWTRASGMLPEIMPLSAWSGQGGLR